MRFIYSKLFIWFFVSLIIVASFLALETRGLISPIQRVILSLPGPVVRIGKVTGTKVKGFMQTIYSLKNLVAENTALKYRVAILEQGQVVLDGLKKENEDLKKELGFVTKPPAMLVPCTVLAQDPEGITFTALLNCGASQGVRQGQGVVSGGYLVGKVWLVSSTTSTVQLLTSPEIAIDASISNSNISGLVKGSFGSGVIMDFISQNTQINNGDLVITAGINESMPKGILIGQVGKTITSQSELFKKVTVTAPVDFKNLSYVFVLK